MRTLDNGRGPLSVVSEPVGERPLDGGEVKSLFPSNMALRLRTPLLARLLDIAKKDRASQL